MNYRIVIKIVLLISWMTLIFCFSSQNSDDSSRVSDGFITKISKAILRDNYEIITKSKTYGTTVFIVRKTAHFFIYFVLSIIAFSLYYELFGLDKRTILFTILLCFLYSISDEIHQLFVAGRSCELRDVIIDTTSSSISATLNYLIRKKFKKI